MGIDAIFDAHNWALVPFHFWSLVFFVFGCIVGSFLNVCIYRMPLEHEHRLAAVALSALQVFHPVVSEHPAGDVARVARPLQKLRRAISPRYFIVELLTGVAFLGCWLAFGRNIAASPGAGVRRLSRRPDRGHVH